MCPAEICGFGFIDNNVDSSTGTIKLKAFFTNGTKRLWPGQFASVRIMFPSLKDAVTVPSQAVQTGQKGEYVFVVKEDMTVDIRPVKTGARAEGAVVILAGLAAGEQIVTDGQIRLGPGAKIEIRKSGQTDPAKTPGMKNNSGAKAKAGL